MHANKTQTNLNRYFLEISYDGSAYHGWQVQKNAVSVQEKINDGLSKKLREDIQCTGSGRTDTGVHALMQVAHFDSTTVIKDPKTFLFQLNSMLPNDISANQLFAVNADASARFDAESRSYIYRIHQSKNPFLQGKSYFFTRKLDLELMNKACDILLQWTDFEAFSKVHTDVKTFQCNITAACWKHDNGKLVFSVTANRFLRGMVRTLVGTMLDLGENKISLADFQAVLESRDRRRAGRSVPACGLYLSNIEFPKTIKI